MGAERWSIPGIRSHLRRKHMNEPRVEVRNTSRRNSYPLRAAGWLVSLLSVCAFGGSRGLVAGTLVAPVAAGGYAGCNSLRIKLLAARNPVLAREVEILASRVQER